MLTQLLNMWKTAKKFVQNSSHRGTQITDINTDCLESIFKYLTLSDLLNVSDASKHFKDAADIVFSAKYGRKAVIIGEMRRRLPDNINIDDLKMSLQLLRCFGHLIVKLNIHLDFKLYGVTIGLPRSMCATKFGVEYVGHLVNYVGLYCSASLASLTIKNGTLEVLNVLEGPFLKMEEVEIDAWFIESKLDKSWFHRLFPNIKCLKYESVCGRITDYECIEKEFKSLERLDISYGFFRCQNLSNLRQITIEERIAHNTNVKAAIKRNSQLKILSLPFISDFSILQDISKHKQQLECLSFQYAPEYPFSFNEQIVHFKTIKKLEMCFCRPNGRPIPGTVAMTTNEMQQIPLSFDSLEELTFQTCHQNSDELFDFIRKHQSIVKLKLISCIWPRFDLDVINRSKLLQALPLLKEIHLMCCKLKIDEAIAFTTSFKSLEKICFELYSEDNYSDLVKMLSHEWNSSLCDGWKVTLTRKC